MTAAPIPDWTRGEPAVVLQRCLACTQVWSFHRDFCPACGAREPESFASVGRGVVYASSVVHRAPDDAFRAIAPYLLVLVELDEGPRVMAHAEPGLDIGDRVTLGFRTRAGRLVPYFEPAAPPGGRDR
jgi:uncharacterized OB-fold protein